MAKHCHIIIVFAIIVLGMFYITPSAHAETVEYCDQCSTDATTIQIKGRLESISLRARLLKIISNEDVWFLSFDDETNLTGVAALNEIERGSEILVDYVQETGALRAKNIVVSAAAVVDELKLIAADSLASLMQQSKGVTPYTLVDARPSGQFSQSHIPTAVSIYNEVFDRNIDSLPDDKDELLIYYCGGTS